MNAGGLKIIDFYKGLSDGDKVEVLAYLTQDLMIKNPLGFIENRVCYHLKMPYELLKSKTRKQEVVMARYLIMFFARKYTTYSLKYLGSMIGGKDHATVIHACKRINVLYEKKLEVKMLVDILNNELQLPEFKIPEAESSTNELVNEF